MDPRRLVVDLDIVPQSSYVDPIYSYDRAQIMRVTIGY